MASRDRLKSSRDPATTSDTVGVLPPGVRPLGVTAKTVDLTEDKPVDLTEDKPPEVLGELRQLLDTELPQSIADFVYQCEHYRSFEDLHSGAVERLAQLVRQIRDSSWRHGNSDADIGKVYDMFIKVVSSIQTVITSHQDLDLRSIVDEGKSIDACLSAVAFGLDVSSMYFTLAGCFGAPASLLNEDLGVRIVAFVKHIVKSIAARYFASDAEGNSREQALRKVLHGDHVESAKRCIERLGALMRNIAEYLCRHRFADENLHELVHVAISCFFFSEPDFDFLAAVEDMLVTIFSRNDHLRTSILQDFFVKVPKLPSGKRAKKFKLPVSQDSPDFGLSTSTHLLLRLVQSCCLPLSEPLGSVADYSAVVNAHNAAQAVLVQLTAGVVQRLLLTQAKDDELRAVLDELVEEVLSVMFKPTWPGAIALTRALVQHFIGVIQPEKRKASIDAFAREFALKLLGKIAAHLSTNHVEVSNGLITLPRWDEPPNKSRSEERLLQHIALRMSLEQSGSMPWTEAARAAEAWDAELFLKHEGEDHSGLSEFTDAMAFRYIALTHVADERYQYARVPPIKGVGDPGEALSTCVFLAGHPIHAWSFLVCDWADSTTRTTGTDASPLEETSTSKHTGRPRKQARLREEGGANVVSHALTNLEQFLANTWASRCPFSTEGAGCQISGGRHALLPYTVFKIYRQLRSIELDALRRAAIDCVVLQANSPQATLRKTAMRGLSDIINADSTVLAAKPVEQTIEMRLQDESSWVRQVSLDLLGGILEGSLDKSLETGDGECWIAPPSHHAETDNSTLRGLTASAMLLRFYETVRGRVNDTSVLVRRQASKILSAFVLNHPEHPDVDEVALDLLRRSVDSEILRNLVVGTFEMLWFDSEEPTPKQAQQLARVVDASKNMGIGSENILSELLCRFKKNLNRRKRSKGFEYAMQRWIAVVLKEFVQFGEPTRAPARRVSSKTSDNLVEKSSSKKERAWVQRRSLLATLEAFAVARPQNLLAHLRPLTIYLTLEDAADSEEQWIAMKVCQIFSIALPYATEVRTLMDHKQVQQDLQQLIKSQSSSGVHEAVRCLCATVKHVTGDLGQLLVHVNTAIPALTQLCHLGEKKLASTQRIQQMYMSRQAWILASIFESLSIDDYVESNTRRQVPLSALRFAMVGGTIAATVADLLIRLYALGQNKLKLVVIACLGYFLQGQRSFVKDRRIIEIFGSALDAPDLSIRLKALEVLSALLAHFGRQADQETQPLGAKTNNDSGAATAVESAQPLAAFRETVLAHITLSLRDDGCDMYARIRSEALGVARQFHQLGLVNPMTVLPKAFALCFVSDAALADRASAMLQDMLELRPTLLLNRLEEALHEAFRALMLAGNRITDVPWNSVNAMGNSLFESQQQLTPICDMYAERFRKQKTLRETLIRKTLREIFRMDGVRFKQQFAHLIDSVTPTSTSALEDKENGLMDVPPAKRSRQSARARRIKVVVTEEEAIVGEDVSNSSSATNDIGNMSQLEKCQLLYVQFVATAISALPFTFESEPLLVIFECNRHLSLHAGALTAGIEPTSMEADAADEEATHGGEDVANDADSSLRMPLQLRNTLPDEVGEISTKPVTKTEIDTDGDVSLDAFGRGLAIIACLALKKTMKADYGLSDEQCAQYNPKDVRQERLRTAGFASQNLAAFRSASAADEAPLARMRFPVDKFLDLAVPLIQNAKNPKALASYVRTLTDDDPWDSSVSRHATAIERLSGSSRGARAARGRGRGRGRAAGNKQPGSAAKQSDPPASKNLRRPRDDADQVAEEALPRLDAAPEAAGIDAEGCEEDSCEDEDYEDGS